MGCKIKLLKIIHAHKSKKTIQGLQIIFMIQNTKTVSFIIFLLMGVQ